MERDNNWESSLACAFWDPMSEGCARITHPMMPEEMWMRSAAEYAMGRKVRELKDVFC
jgi:hypothetical protein